MERIRRLFRDAVLFDELEQLLGFLVVFKVLADRCNELAEVATQGLLEILCVRQSGVAFVVFDEYVRLGG